MSEDLEYLIERLENQAGTNQCVVVYHDKCCKILREDYFPDEDGILTFHRKMDWTYEGYSVDEALELLKKYSDRISKVLFESYDGSIQEMVNVYESDSIGTDFEYSCFILVGEPGEPLKRYGNPQNDNWMTDTFYHRNHKL